MMKKLLLTVALAFTTWVGMYAQGVTTASINGQVTDKNGETLPGANVIAIHVPSGTKYGATTRTDGRYNFPAVRIGGPYTLTVSFVGYEDQKNEIDYLSLDQDYTSNFKLGENVQSLSEVQITAQKDPVLNSERTGAATSLRRELFERLPTITRSFQDMVALDPRSNGANSSFGFGGRSNLYNNFTIDGATSNNVFGLNALPGGQTNSQPISVDAIQAVQVNFAPYDVRQGAFTGAGVNAVTRSGTNEFSGSAYTFYKNQSMVGTKVEGQTQSNANFAYQNTGFRLGGPIIKDKLFFFANYEFEKSVSPAVTYPVNAGYQQVALPSTDPNYSSENNLQRIVDFFKNPSVSMNNFNPGSFNNFDVPTQSSKYLARLDFNISDQHKLTVRYNQLNAFRDVPPSNSGGIGSAPSGQRQNNNNALPFSNSYYRQLNNLYNIVAELNSTFSSKYSNTFTIGYSALRDPRQQGGGGTPANFPTVDILGTNGSNLTTFGPDPFTPNNKLYQDIIQINDNFNIYKPNHVITVGTANEFFKFTNTFTQQINGVYQYSSISNFIANANPATASAANAPTQYLLQYSAVNGNPAPGAIWKAQQLGFYVQDQFTGFKNVKLTYGMRIDLPTFPTSLPQNTTSDGYTFANGEKVKVGQLPGLNPLYSPRVGFNWDVKGDKTLQVRGGTGVFTGRVPFVWLSNQVTNNGLLFGSIISQGAANTYPTYNFKPTPITNTSGGPSPQFAINATVHNFKCPQVWRTNLAIDKSLPGGLIGTVELIYTKNLNAVYYRDANFNAPVGTVTGDGRPMYSATIAPNPAGGTDANGNQLWGRRVNQLVTQAVILDNTSKGYQYSATAQLQKTFNKGIYASAAYTYQDSRDVNSETGSTASTNLTSYAQVAGYNTPVLSYSSNLATHHIVGSASYRKEYSCKFMATTISGIYQGSSGFRYSYTYNGDVNSDGNSTNDLIYIPKNQNDILLTTSGATDTRSVSQIWQQLDNFINNDPYLKKHRGEYAARNGAVAPWFNVVNLRLLQDFFILKQETENGNTLQLSFEAINFLNLLNSSWGVVRMPARQSLLTLAGFENPAVTTTIAPANNLLPNPSYTNTQASGRPVYQF